MAYSFSIRQAALRDLDSLASIRHALWPESSVAEHARELADILSGKPLSTLPSETLVAEASDATLVGFLEVGLRSHADGCDPTRPVGYLEGWYVAESHRRQGVGAAILRAAEEWSRAHGCREIASDTQLTNTLSQQVHKSLGFQIAERAILYRKLL